MVDDRGKPAALRLSPKEWIGVFTTLLTYTVIIVGVHYQQWSALAAEVRVLQTRIEYSEEHEQKVEKKLDQILDRVRKVEQDIARLSNE